MEFPVLAVSEVIMTSYQFAPEEQLDEAVYSVVPVTVVNRPLLVIDGFTLMEVEREPVDKEPVDSCWYTLLPFPQSVW